MFFTIANFITAFRLGLFAWFIVLVGEERLPLAALIFFLVWALDAVDGFLARRLNQASEVGSLFDKVSDRVMLGGAFFALLAYGLTPVWAVFIFTKEIGLLLVWLLQPRQRQIDLGVSGKIATFLQGVTLLWLMLQWPHPLILIAVSALFGIWVALRQAQGTSSRPVYTERGT